MTCLVYRAEGPMWICQSVALGRVVYLAQGAVLKEQEMTVRFVSCPSFSMAGLLEYNSQSGYMTPQLVCNTERQFLNCPTKLCQSYSAL